MYMLTMFPISFSIFQTSRSIRVDAGQHLKIPCKFQIDPHPSNKIIKFEWAKVITINDTIFEEAIDQKNPKFDWGMDGIHIAKSQRSDSGIYRYVQTFFFIHLSLV